MNEVATMLLNGEIEREKAASYSSLARVVSQTVSSEITRARFVKESPNLGLDEEVFEEPEGVILGEDE